MTDCTGFLEELGCISSWQDWFFSFVFEKIKLIWFKKKYWKIKQQSDSLSFRNAIGAQTVEGKAIMVDTVSLG